MTTNEMPGVKPDQQRLFRSGELVATYFKEVGLMNNNTKP